MCVKIPDTILRQCRTVIEYQHISTNEWLLFAMTQAQRLPRGFNIDIATCEQCGGPVKVIASIEVPTVIRKIRNYLTEKIASVGVGTTEHTNMLENWLNMCGDATEKNKRAA